MTEESPPIVDASENDFFELPKIERYNVLELLGRGGMGVVVKATHLQLNKLVAIKVLHTSLLDQMSRKRFEIEAQAGSSLCHPNLVSVFDYGITEDGKPFMVMEFIDGKSLQYFLEEQGKMPVELFLPVFEQVAKGLQHIHNQNIVHRDIKTSNIMIQHIEGDLYAKLVDFGIAKILEQSGIPAQRLTETGSLFGSPLYMSPEQCRGLEVGVQSDIYSIGCVMYECLSGEPPIAGENALKTIFMHVNEDPPPLSELASDDATLKDIARLIHKCMNKDPEKRFQSGAELLSEFKRISESKEARRYQAGSAGNRWIKAAAQKKQPEKHCFEPEVLAENRRTVSFDTSSSTEQGAEIEIRFEGQTPESSLQGRKPTGQDLRREMAEIESRDPSRLLKMAVAGFALLMLIAGGVFGAPLISQHLEKVSQAQSLKKAVVLFDKGESYWGEAEPLFRTALDYAEKTEAGADQGALKKAQIHNYLGRIFLHNAKLPGARANFSAALKLVDASAGADESGAYLDGLLGMAECYRLSGASLKAEKYLKEARQLAAKSGSDARRTGDILASSARVADALKKPPEAVVSFFDQAIAAYEKAPQGHFEKIAQAWLDSALLSNRMKWAPETVRRAQRAIESASGIAIATRKDEIIRGATQLIGHNQVAKSQFVPESSTAPTTSTAIGANTANLGQIQVETSKVEADIAAERLEQIKRAQAAVEQMGRLQDENFKKTSSLLKQQSQSVREFPSSKAGPAPSVGALKDLTGGFIDKE